MAYSDFGLDDVKKSTDDEVVGKFHCPFCQKEVTDGFSLCFSNFCICAECVELAKTNKKQWAKADEFGCFKCNKGKVKKEFDKLYYDKAGTLSICQECIDWASEVLNNKEKYISNMIQDILKNCTIEGLVVKLPTGQLDRKVYTEVKNKLELIGGQWKGGKTQGFVFEEDPTELLAQISEGEHTNLKKEHQFFATPKELALQMAAYLPEDINSETRFLEPSAGDGALIKATMQHYDCQIKFDCFELMELNQTKLSRIEDIVLQGFDFLTHCIVKDYYDIIIANPPFSKNQDIDHIRKMFEVCKPGGRIVTLSSPSWTFGSQKKQVEFRDWLAELGTQQFVIGEGAFKESGTTIKTILLVINKPLVDIQVSDTTPEEIKVEAAKHLLRNYKGYAFFDGGKYEQTGLMQILIYRETFRETFTPETAIPIEAIYYEYENAGSINKAIERAKDWVNNVRKCRVCGCTESDCQQCIEKTGSPCHWVEKDLCSACEEPKSPETSENNETLELPQKLNDMNFFEQLAAIGNVDLTIRVMQKNDTLTINVMPGNSSSRMQPILVSGTPAELDEGFFTNIMPGVVRVQGLLSNINSVEEGLEKSEKEVTAPAKRKTTPNKPASKKVAKAVTETKSQEQAPLFEE